MVPKVIILSMSTLLNIKQRKNYEEEIFHFNSTDELNKFLALLQTSFGVKILSSGDSPTLTKGENVIGHIITKAPPSDNDGTTALEF
jgi:hypothetical protein